MAGRGRPKSENRQIARIPVSGEIFTAFRNDASALDLPTTYLYRKVAEYHMRLSAAERKKIYFDEPTREADSD